MNKLLLIIICLSFTSFAKAQTKGQTIGQNDSPEAVKQSYATAVNLFQRSDFVGAAKIFFDIYTLENEKQNAALGYLTESLMRSEYYNAASYFYIKTLQSGNKSAIRRVLVYLPIMLEHVGGDVLRKYIIRYTNEGDYDNNAKNHFFYFLGKDELLKDSPEKALAALLKINSGSGIMAQAAYLRGTAYAMLNQNQNALAQFKLCRKIASQSVSRTKSLAREYDDLEARCQASVARVNYQAGDYARAEEEYDEVVKSSFVWTDILFEQAWNAYAKGDYNRALGKLVTYRSPSLNFVFNPEVEVLRAQSLLALCVYDDLNKTVNEFNGKYASVGEKLKYFLGAGQQDFNRMYGLGKNAMHAKLHNQDLFTNAINRFARGPYFASLVHQERATEHEIARAQSFASSDKRAFASFLQKVLQWRLKSIKTLGGLFIRNTMVDLYQDLIAEFDKISFIKLEMLKHSKLALEKKQIQTEDEDGVLKRGSNSIDRKDYQYYWSFNGEFWIDELGDYVFALESQCGA